MLACLIACLLAWLIDWLIANQFAVVLTHPFSISLELRLNSCLTIRRPEKRKLPVGWTVSTNNGTLIPVYFCGPFYYNLKHQTVRGSIRNRMWRGAPSQKWKYPRLVMSGIKERSYARAVSIRWITVIVCHHSTARSVQSRHFLPSVQPPHTQPWSSLVKSNTFVRWPWPYFGKKRKFYFSPILVAFILSLWCISN